MTEFEMAYLFNDMLLALGATASLFFATLTAFLVASYLVASKLTRMMAVIAVGLFLLSELGSISMMYRIMQSMAGLGREMRAFAQAGKGLAWHRLATASDWTIDLPRYAGTGLYIIATAAAVYFFFLCRWQKVVVEQSPPQLPLPPT